MTRNHRLRDYNGDEDNPAYEHHNAKPQLHQMSHPLSLGDAIGHGDRNSRRKIIKPTRGCIRNPKRDI